MNPGLIGLRRQIGDYIKNNHHVPFEGGNNGSYIKAVSTFVQ